jgi:hypothetical protein
MQHPAGVTVLKTIRDAVSSVRAFFKPSRNPATPTPAPSTLMTHAAVKAEIDRLASSIGASQAESLPTYGYSEQSGRPHVEVDELGYHYVVAERGEEFERFTTQNLDELLYWVFESVTHTLAGEYGLQHRVEGQDSRRLIFQRQTELLLLLSTSWAERNSDERNKILHEHPFDDSGTARAILTKELLGQGHSTGDAWRIASEKYPVPNS